MVLPIASGGVTLRPTAPLGFEQVIPPTSEPVPVFEFATPAPSVACVLELLIYPTENASADVLPETLFYLIDAIAHGDQVHELQPQLTLTAPTAGFQHKWRAMPSNGIRVRFSARRVRVAALASGTAGKRIRASVQPITAGIERELLPPVEYALPGAGLFPASHAFPVGAREWKCTSDNPLTPVGYFMMDNLGTAFGIATAAAFASWTVIPARAFGFQVFPGVGNTPVTAVFR